MKPSKYKPSTYDEDLKDALHARVRALSGWNTSSSWILGHVAVIEHFKGIILLTINKSKIQQINLTNAQAGDMTKYLATLFEV